MLLVIDDMTMGTVSEQELLLAVVALCITEELDAPTTWLHHHPDPIV